MDKKVIFLVEDDAFIRDVIKSALEREYDLLEAPGCSDAVVMMNNPYDIALIDYILPDGDGITVLKAIRALKPEMPVILMTAYSSEEVLIKALRAGATDYIKKPLVLSYLREKVSSILAGGIGDVTAEDPAYASRETFLLDSIAAFIENNYSADITREMLAKKVCMNKYKFSKIFNDKFGQSLKSYLNNIRVNKAAEFLKNYDLSIKDIAFAVGFESAEHFSRVFKESCNISPRKYRTDNTKKSAELLHLWQSD
jgi:YesN/AraC family two-component response regulator